MNVRIEWSYKTPKGLETTFFTEEMPAAAAVALAEDLERTGRSKHIGFVDKFDSSWTMKEMKAYLKGIETEPHNVTVYFDGGYDRQTRKAGVGCVVYYEQNGKSYRLRANALFDNLVSNNESEYAALYFCLQELEHLEIHHLPIRFLGDSRTVVEGLSNDWPAAEELLTAWINRIEQKIAELGIQADYNLIPRKVNAEADKLATQALNDVVITAKAEIIA